MQKAKYLGLSTIVAAAMAASSLVPALAADSYTIGISNTVQGNGWREEMICAMKA